MAGPIVDYYADGCFSKHYKYDIYLRADKSRNSLCADERSMATDLVVSWTFVIMDIAQALFAKLRPANSLYNFRPFGYRDLPMAAHWLQGPEVARWWGDAEKELAVITEDLNEPMMRQWIVEYRGESFGYVQAYPVHAWPQSHFRHLPDEAKAIDAFIGEPDMLGCGHGRAFLRAFAEMLIAEGAPVVAIDPNLDNHRARRAYARAGFVAEEVVETPEGPSVLMLFKQTSVPS
jgi:aminoglycoside 6'-N-acetyltransferase